MEQSQDYSFNKAHAACYALIAYRTAWLRAHHPHEYMAALISSVMSTKDRVPFYVNACHELGIEVLPPDVNASQVDFAVVEGKIRFGLNAVKNVGEAACVAIVAAREAGGPFESIWDFTERVDPQVVNRRALESLVQLRRSRLDGRLADGDDRGARPGALLGRQRARGRAAPARGRSSTSSRRGRSGRATTRRSRRTSTRRPSCSGWRRRRSALWVSEHPLADLRAPS